MSKEIEKCKNEIAKLEKELNGVLSKFRDNSEIYTKLAKEHVFLAKLYQKNKQNFEALEQLQLAYKYYSNPAIKEKYNSGDEPCIEILKLQVECSKSISNVKQQIKYLGELLNQLVFAKAQKNMKQIPIYLEDYILLVPGAEGLEKIEHVLSYCDRNSHPHSYNYRDVLKLKASYLCELEHFSEAYEAYLDLIEQYGRLKNNRSGITSSYLSQDEKMSYLNAFSLAKINCFSINEAVQDIINQLHQQHGYYLTNYEVTFEATSKNSDYDSLKQMILLYQCLNMTTPMWLPKHSIKKMDPLSYYSNPNDNSFISSPKKKFEQPLDVELFPLIDEPPRIADHERIKQKIKDDWSQLGVGGYQEVIEELIQKVFKPRSLSPEQLDAIGIDDLPGGGILFGPPGTGKTLIARTIASHFFEKENVFVINGPELISKFVGESAENLRKILDRAKLEPNKTFVLIIDEIESLLGARNSSEEGVSKQIKSDLTTTLLTYLDGVNPLKNLMVFGTTNYLDRLDSALLRSGRLDVHFYVGLPNKEERLAIIKVHSETAKKSLSPDVDFNLLAEHSEGLSGSDIKVAIRNAKIKFIDINSEQLDAGKAILPLGTDLLLSCLKEKLEEKNKEQTEQEVLISRPFCQFSQSLIDATVSIRKKVQKSPYLRPMLFNVSGDSETGTTSFALNLFPDNKDGTVYIKAGELASLSSKEQEKYLDERFSQALSKRNSVLIIDDLEDIKACPFKPIIYLKNKFKMALPEGKSLNVVLVGKQEHTVNELFTGQLSFDMAIKMSPISKTEEIIKVSEAFGLYMKRTNHPPELKVVMPIGQLHNKLLTYCKKNTLEKRTIDDFIHKINSKEQISAYSSNANVLFAVKTNVTGHDVLFNGLSSSL